MKNLPKVVYFADYKEQLQEMVGADYNNAKEAALILESNKVRYILKSGTTMDANGIRAEYSNPKDVPTYTDINELLRVELLPFLKNECKRMDYFKQQGKKYYY